MYDKLTILTECNAANTNCGASSRKDRCEIEKHVVKCGIVVNLTMNLASGEC